MKFNLIDSVLELTDTRIVATKHVSLAEEYLADHFPTFPVLPGVMMLEAATQAAGWLMHHRTGFGKSVAVLKEARNVKYGHFVAPGHYLKLDVQYSARHRGRRKLQSHRVCRPAPGASSEAGAGVLQPRRAIARPAGPRRKVVDPYEGAMGFTVAGDNVAVAV